MVEKPYDIGGYTNRQENIKDLKIEPALEIIENKFPDRDYTVELVTDEFSSICPKTGLPDFATFIIQYIPDRNLVEEKSLKLYLTAYRNIGIFQEHATNKVFDDFFEVVKPRWLKINARWKKRGGIGVNVSLEKKA